MSIPTWSAGLCGCFEDFETTLKVFFCAPIFLSLAKSEWDGTNCCLNFLCANAIGLRHQVRTIYAIEGNCCADILIGYFCFCCSAIQVMRTMKTNGPIHKAMN